MNIADHRVRVAAEKREKMRRKLVECALVVFARKGVDAAVIDEVIALAGVSRGTFYNYFKTNQELLLAVVQQMADELFWLIEQVVGHMGNPLERVATAMRLTLHTARRYPQFGHFFVRSNMSADMPHTLAHEFLSRDLGLALAQGKLRHTQMDTAIDLIVGTTFAGVQALLTRPRISVDYPERLVTQVLLGLGQTAATAARLAALPLHEIDIPPHTLLERSSLLEAERSQSAAAL